MKDKVSGRVGKRRGAKEGKESGGTKGEGKRRMGKGREE